jgi:uncharacterized cupin superfamily protein
MGPFAGAQDVLVGQIREATWENSRREPWDPPAIVPPGPMFGLQSENTMTIAIAPSRSTVAGEVAEAFTGFDAVLDGEPAARVAWLRTGSGGEGMLYTGMFTAQPSTFRYTFGGDESFHVLDGDFDIAVDSGPVITLGPGDIASFPKGAASTWTIRAALRKFFVISG